jgi:signal transduction histidine kinase
MVQRPFVLASADHGHVVQFYEDDRFLREVLTDFSGAGLQAGETVILIATEANRQAVARRLAELGYDVEAAAASGRLVLLDAGELLASIMVGGIPSSDLFAASLRRLFAQPRAEGRRLRVYGEMVDLLCRAGNHRAAIRLEELGNDLVRTDPVGVLCGYSMDGFARASDAAGFERVCDLHTGLRPAEGYTRARDAGADMREVARLQQRARALESELRERQGIEVALRQALDREQVASRAKSQFLTTLGHELRDPLGAIVLALDLLNAELGSGAAQEREILDREVRRLVRLLEDLLDAARVMNSGPTQS